MAPPERPYTEENPHSQVPAHFSPYQNLPTNSHYWLCKHPINLRYHKYARDEVLSILHTHVPQHSRSHALVISLDSDSAVFLAIVLSPEDVTAGLWRAMENKIRLTVGRHFTEHELPIRYTVGDETRGEILGNDWATQGTVIPPRENTRSRNPANGLMRQRENVLRVRTLIARNSTSGFTSMNTPLAATQRQILSVVPPRDQGLIQTGMASDQPITGLPAILPGLGSLIARPVAALPSLQQTSARSPASRPWGNLDTMRATAASTSLAMAFAGSNEDSSSDDTVVDHSDSEGSLFRGYLDLTNGERERGGNLAAERWFAGPAVAALERRWDIEK